MKDLNLNGTQTSKNLNHDQQINEGNNPDDLQTMAQNGHSYISNGQNGSNGNNGKNPVMTCAKPKLSDKDLNMNNYSNGNGEYSFAFLSGLPDALCWIKTRK